MTVGEMFTYEMIVDKITVIKMTRDSIMVDKIILCGGEPLCLTG